MKIYINNRADQLEEIDNDQLVQAFWASDDGNMVLEGMRLERMLLNFLSRYGTFESADPESGYETLYEKVLEAMPR